MARSASYPHCPAPEAPLGEINTTPLIDVMLVLLVMFVITIPVANHALEIPLPSGEGIPEIRPSNTVAIGGDDRLTWNEQPITLAQLSATLAVAARQPVEPEVRFAPDGQSSYGIAAEVLRRIKLSGVGAFGFVGTERFGDFARPAPR